jgi:hypothetical protein
MILVLYTSMLIIAHEWLLANTTDDRLGCLVDFSLTLRAFCIFISVTLPLLRSFSTLVKLRHESIVGKLRRTHVAHIKS